MPMRSPWSLMVVLVGGMGLLLSSPSHAQDGDAILKIQERAKYLNDFKALLEHSDPSVRLAAVNEGLKGSDPGVRTLAMEAGLASTDQRVQTAALRWLFRERTRIPVAVVLPKDADAEQAYAYDRWHGLVLQQVEINEKTDEIQLKNSYYAGGQLVRGGFDLRFERANDFNCVLAARVAGPSLLTGSIDCTLGQTNMPDRELKRATLPVRIDLS